MKVIVSPVEFELSRKQMEDKRNSFQEAVMREIRGWNVATAINIAPRIVDFLIKNDMDNHYCLIVSEKMDETVGNLLTKIDSIADIRTKTEYQFIVYQRIFDMLIAYHKIHYYHGDPHLSNIMIKSRDRSRPTYTMSVDRDSSWVLLRKCFNEVY